MKRTTKKTLAASLLSLLLCVAMLIGSTYAWFSDTASTKEVTITAGNLDVEIVDSSNQAFTEENKLFKGVDKLEPGMMIKSEEFKIKNAGTLALTYTITIEKAEVTEQDKEVVDLSKVLSLKVVKATEVSALGEHQTRKALWDSLTGDKELTTGVIYPESGKGVSRPTEDQVTPVGEVAGLVAVLYWDPTNSTSMDTEENKDNKYNFDDLTKKVAETNISLNVFATQTPAEKDSFGEKYDDGLIKEVKDANELNNALENYKEGDEIVFTGDINNGSIFLGGANSKLKDNDSKVQNVVIDLNGHTLKRTADGGCAVYSENKNVTIKNAEIVHESTGTNCAAVRAYGGSVTLENCTLKNNASDQYGSYCVEVKGGATVTMNNCTIDNTANGCINVYSGCKLVINGGKIKTTKYYPLYVVKYPSTTKVDISCTGVNFEATAAIMYMNGTLAQGDTLSFTNCTFKAPKFEIKDTTLTGATFSNCTLNGSVYPASN